MKKGREMKRRLIALLMLLALTGCAARGTTTNAPITSDATMGEESERIQEETMKLYINDTEVPVTWENNASVEALRALCPLRLELSMYGGFEQVGPIGTRIVRDDRQTTTTAGDVVLYAGDQIVLFYGANTWAYTRLGHIDLSEREMSELLGRGDVVIRLE